MSQFKDWLNRTFNGKKIEMLGLKDAGKTQFLKSLGCKEANPEVVCNIIQADPLQLSS